MRWRGTRTGSTRRSFYDYGMRSAPVGDRTAEWKAMLADMVAKGQIPNPSILGGPGVARTATTGEPLRNGKIP